MKLYYYGTPSNAFPLWCMRIIKRWGFMRYPVAALMVGVFVIALPVAYVLMQAGALGHAIAGWCGADFVDDPTGKWL